MYQGLLPKTCHGCSKSDALIHSWAKDMYTILSLLVLSGDCTPFGSVFPHNDSRRGPPENLTNRGKAEISTSHMATPGTGSCLRGSRRYLSCATTSRFSEHQSGALQIKSRGLSCPLQKSIASAKSNPKQSASFAVVGQALRKKISVYIETLRQFRLLIRVHRDDVLETISQS